MSTILTPFCRFFYSSGQSQDFKNYFICFFYFIHLAQASMVKVTQTTLCHMVEKAVKGLRHFSVHFKRRE